MMLLRRVIEHVREQNWTAIGIDFVIVVLGVFVGIQVANWNQERADQRRGRAYAQRLLADLSHDLASRRTLVDYYGVVLASVESTDKLLADPQSDPMALVVNAYRASEFSYGAPSQATWNEIVSAGDVGLLDRQVAIGAADYFAYDSADGARDTLIQSAYRHRVRTLIPLAVQKALRAGCSDVRNEAQDITGFMADCALEVDPAVIAATAAALRADPAVVEELRYQYSDVYSAHANIQGDMAAIERALAAVRAPTGTPP